MITTYRFVDDKTKTETDNWLDSCPSPVIARIIPDESSLRHLVLTTHLYPEDMLVVIPIKLLKVLK
jgi:hypothetical protein